MIENPGSIRIEWFNYALTLHTGLVVAALIFTLFLILYIHRLWVKLTLWPAALRNKQSLKNTQKAMTHMNMGLSSIAAQDIKSLDKHIKKINHLLPNDEAEKNSMLILLRAQAEFMKGNQNNAITHWKKLSHSQDMSFLGTRQLLQHQEHSHQELLLHALTKDPKNPWLLEFALHDSIQSHNFTLALSTLEKQKKHMHDSKYRRHKIALLLARANEGDQPLKDIKSAHKLDPFFAPSLRRLAMQPNAKHVKDKIKRAWTYAPHPELIDAWMALLPAKDHSRPMAKMKWIEKLVTKNPSKPIGALACAKIALQENLWGQAHHYARLAEKTSNPNHINPEIYEILAQLERTQNRDENAAQNFLARARECQDDKIWICNQTGAQFEKWQAFIGPHFNSLQWEYPSNISLTQNSKTLSSNSEYLGLS